MYQFGIEFGVKNTDTLCMAKIDLKEITAKAKDKPNKAKSSIYLNQDIYASFKAKCKKEGVKVSKVLEAFMIEYSK